MSHLQFMNCMGGDRSNTQHADVTYKCLLAIMDSQRSKQSDVPEDELANHPPVIEFSAHVSANAEPGQAGTHTHT